jgi:hypothetical protein
LVADTLDLRAAMAMIVLTALGVTATGLLGRGRARR